MNISWPAWRDSMKTALNAPETFASGWFDGTIVGCTPTEIEPSPAGLRTAEGVGLGSTVAEVGRAYPDASLFGGDELATASIQISDDLFAFVTGTEDTGVVTAMLGGQGCGE